uniref:Uncharacterized protein n=1 Tax=Meloidogyne enterolobii TaxID=390850 RepID=A0A6V7X8H6_MELEN|nr:unnamed protein product [Meloidogyne enterolobii]
MKIILTIILFFFIFLPASNGSYPFEKHFRRITNWAHEKLWGLESAFISNPASIELKNQLLANYYKEYLLAETKKKAKEIKLKISSTTFLSIIKRFMDYSFNDRLTEIEKDELNEFLKNKIEIILTGKQKLIIDKIKKYE